MAHVLVVDDRPTLGGGTVKALRAAGHDAELVCECTVGKFYDTIRSTCFDPEQMKKRGIEKWNVLVLDINFHSDQWGGVWLYNKLAQAHRHQWDVTVIYSMYYGTGLRAARADDGDLFRLRIFVDTAAIPDEYLLSNKTGGREELVNKLIEFGFT